MPRTRRRTARFPGAGRAIDPELLYVRSRRDVKRLALDYDGVAADLYWIRALQHFGRERLAPPEHVNERTRCCIRCST